MRVCGGGLGRPRPTIRGNAGGNPAGPRVAPPSKGLDLEPRAAPNLQPTTDEQFGRRSSVVFVGRRLHVRPCLSVVGRTFFAGQARLLVVCCRLFTTPQPRYTVSTYNVQPTTLFVGCTL